MCVEGEGGKDRIKNESCFCWCHLLKWRTVGWFGVGDLQMGVGEDQENVFVCDVFEMAMKYN